MSARVVGASRGSDVSVEWPRRDGPLRHRSHARDRGVGESEDED